MDDAQGDFNCNGQTDIVDAVFMVNYIFASGPAPCAGPQWKGVLLVGNPDSLALNATTDLFPIAADEDDVDSSGFIRTKLEAIIDPAATIGSVNAALNQFNARISSMVEGIPFVSLMVPRLFNRASADSLAALMAPSSAFAYVFPAFAPGNDSLVVTTTVPSMRPAMTPGGPADNNLGHLIRMKMPAAWNFKEMIPAGQKVSVVVPDKYYSLSPSPEISAQRFVPGGDATIDAFGDYYSGNHGFHVSGILGANFDAQGATGTHPDAAAHLDLMSMPIGGWDFTDILHGLTISIGESLPGGHFVLNTSLGYNDPKFEDMDKFKRTS